jgi:hypothetical protein
MLPLPNQVIRCACDQVARLSPSARFGEPTPFGRELRRPTTRKFAHRLFFNMAELFYHMLSTRR